MTSTTTSKPLLEVKNLHLSFDLDLQKGHTVRDAFVQLLRAPVKTLLERKNVHPVLEDISFSMEKGDIMAVIGENGSGKTSLCRCIAGMIMAQQGIIKKPDNIQAVFSTASAIHFSLTGKENAYLLGELLFPSLSKSELRDVIEEALDFSDLGKFQEAPFYTYSKGMQARLFLSVVTARPTELLILDEVYDGADEFFQDKMKERMHKVIYESGAVLFISHNAELVSQICNKALVIHERKLAFQGGNVKKALALYKNLHRGAYKTGS